MNPTVANAQLEIAAIYGVTRSRGRTHYSFAHAIGFCPDFVAPITNARAKESQPVRRQTLFSANFSQRT
jgi:hypothetical protein